MWLQLSVAWAQETAPPVQIDQAAAALNVYADDDIVAWAPSARARVAVGGGATVGVLWNADFVSGATPVVATDAVSSATMFTEARNGGTLDIELPGPRAWVLDVAVTGSTESDHQVLLGSAGASTALREEMTRVSSRATVGWRRDGTRVDPGAAGDSVDAAVDLGWMQILGPTTTTTLRASGGYARCDETFGCDASAYRYVPQALVFLPEHHPSTRLRGAASIALAQAVGRSFAVHADYRFYGDTWLIGGHTGNAALAWSFAEGSGLLRAEGRGALQSPASFARASYPGVTGYRTADRELSGFTGWTAGLRARWTLFGVLKSERVAIDAHIERLWFVYPNYAAMPTRDAWIVGGGVDVRR